MAFNVTRKISGTRPGSDVREALDEYDLLVLAEEINPRSVAARMNVLNENDSKTGEEIEGLADEVLKIVEGET